MKGMPLIELTFGIGELSEEQKIRLCQKITDLVMKEAKVPQHYTWVMLHEIPAENWMIDRLTVPQLLAQVKAENQ